VTWRLAARRALVLVTLLAALGSAACARDRETDPEPPEPAATPAQFAQRFERLTAVALDPGRDELYGTTFEEPELPDRFQRFGTYTLVWAQGAEQRELALGGEGAARPDREGIYWERVGDGWSAAKPFGDHLVLQWVGPSTKTTTARWDRLERAVRAAYRGDSGLLTEAEQPCRENDVDPIEAEPGQCSIDGIPVTFDDADQPLSTAALDVHVVGVETPTEIGQDTSSPLSPEGRFVVVAYRIKNTGSEPIGFLLPALRLGGRTVEEDNRARSLLPESRAFPLEPGQTTELQTAFDVDAELAEHVRERGALILPAQRDEDGEPAADIAQAWVRLAGVPTELPETPQDPNAAPLIPEEPPEPPGPPDIDVDRGSGPPIGGSARRLYMANTYFPLPEAFVAGGVEVGSRAGGCRIPRPTDRDRSELLAAERRSTPRGRIGRPRDRQILLAECGADGRWAIAFWERRGLKRGLRLNGDEFAYRDGRWVGTSQGETPGCRLPEAAAAVWQIDVSVCD
jgi:hypothetical protein